MTIKIDLSTRRQFVRDFKLPIQIVEDGYFEYFLDLYQEHYGARDKYNLLIETIESFGSLEDFIEESKRIRKEAVDFIKSQPAYSDFESDKLTEYRSDFKQRINLYNHTNSDKEFVSIDMIKGNIQSLNYFDKNILQANTYEEFMSKFTKHEYFVKSKQIRQVIFGNVSPKKQQNIQKFIMNLVKSKLIEQGLKEEDIFAASSDELVIDGRFANLCKEIMKSEDMTSFDFHLDVFKLEEIKADLPVFIKRFKNKNGVEIKMGNGKYMAEVVKYIKQEPLTDYDLYFFDEGRIAKYLEPIILTGEK